MGQLAGGLFGGVVGGGGMGTAAPVLGVILNATHDPFLAIAAFLGTLATAYGVARTIFKNIVRGRERDLRELTARLAEATEESIGPKRLKDR